MVLIPRLRPSVWRDWLKRALGNWRKLRCLSTCVHTGQILTLRYLNWNEWKQFFISLAFLFDHGEILYSHAAHSTSKTTSCTVLCILLQETNINSSLCTIWKSRLGLSSNKKRTTVQAIIFDFKRLRLKLHLYITSLVKCNLQFIWADPRTGELLLHH